VAISGSGKKAEIEFSLSQDSKTKLGTELSISSSNVLDIPKSKKVTGKLNTILSVSEDDDLVWNTKRDMDSKGKVDQLMFKQDSIAQGNKRPEGFSTEGKICNSLTTSSNKRDPKDDLYRFNSLNVSHKPKEETNNNGM